MIIILLTSPKDNYTYDNWTGPKESEQNFQSFDLRNGNLIFFVKNWCDNQTGEPNKGMGELILKSVGDQKEVLVAFHHLKEDPFPNNKCIENLKSQIGSILNNQVKKEIGFLHYSKARGFPRGIITLQDKIGDHGFGDDENAKIDTYKQIFNAFVEAYEVDWRKRQKARIEECQLCFEAVKLMQDAINDGKRALDELNEEFKNETDPKWEAIANQTKEAQENYEAVQIFFNSTQFEDIINKCKDISDTLKDVAGDLYDQISLAERTKKL